MSSNFVTDLRNVLSNNGTCIYQKETRFRDEVNMLNNQALTANRENIHTHQSCIHISCQLQALSTFGISVFQFRYESCNRNPKWPLVLKAIMCVS